MIPAIDKVCNTINIGIAFETITEYMTFFIDESFADKVVDNIDIESLRGFHMNIIL